MAQQQAVQRANTARLSSPATRHRHVDYKAIDAVVSMGRRLFGYLAGALDSSMLESKNGAVRQFELAFASILGDGENLLWIHHNTNFFQLCTSAAVNSINVALQDIRSSLWDDGKALAVVCSLCQTIAQYVIVIQSLETAERPLPEEVENLQLVLKAAGLPSALVRFSEVACKALQQLNSSSWCPQDQQQQQRERLRPKLDVDRQLHSHINRCVTAAFLVDKLLGLWKDLSNSMYAAFQEALPLQIALVAAAPALSKQVTGLASGSSSINSVLAEYEHRVSDIAAMGVFLASIVAVHLQTAPQHKPLAAQQAWQQVLQAEKLPELLVQLVAHQAGILHNKCSGNSPALHDNWAAAARTHTSDLQQQQQQQEEACEVPPSHLALLRSIGLGYPGDGVFEFQSNVQQYELMYAMTLAGLHHFVEMRHQAAQLKSNSTDSCLVDTGQQQQQQQHGNGDSILPSHLLVPAVKVLIEVLLLLPGTSLSIHCATLDLIPVLISAASAAAAAASAPTMGPRKVQPAAVAHWPQLPAAVAAGLLQPVVAHLSQAVIHCLLQTDHPLIQQEQAAQRLALLHDYGNLLLIVCQAVEPKHIAAVLQSQSAPDLLITLAAIEAVLRAQACHLAPEHVKQRSQQWQQQQQEQQSDCSNSSAAAAAAVHSTADGNDLSRSLGFVYDITEHPVQQAPILLLPFASEVVQALDIMFQNPQQQQRLTVLLAGNASTVSSKLAARVCTLLTTALKVGQLAVAAAAPEQQERVCQQAMQNAVAVARLSRCWFSAVRHTSSSMGSSSMLDQSWAMPVGVLFRALHAWVVSWSSCAARYGVQAAERESTSPSAAAAGVHAPSDSPITYDSLCQVLQSLASGFSNAEYVLDHVELLVAAGVEQAAMAASADGPLSRQQRSCSGVVPCCEQLKKVVHQSLKVTAGLNCAVDFSAGVRQRGEECQSSVFSNMLVMLNNLSAVVCDLSNAGIALLPLRVCCSNPDCTALAKLSEWQLVCGKACVCAGCQVARYCSGACQKQPWKLHKPVCSKLSAQQ